MKKLEGSAPGPADLYPKSQFKSKVVSIAPLPASKSRVKTPETDVPLLFPNYNLTKPNHEAKTKYRPAHKTDLVYDKESLASFASTAPTSTLSKAAVSIAPLPYHRLTDKELEILLRK